MTVAPALADVVQQHAHHQEAGALHLAHHLGIALGVGGLAGRERLQVLHREQRVLVGGELVIDVVLHEARERAPLGQVAPEHPQLVHLAEGLRDPAPVATDAEEQLPGLRRRAEPIVDEVEGVLDRPLHVDAQLEPELVTVPEDLQQPQRVLPERAAVGMRQVQLLAEHDEAVRERFLAQPAVHPGPARQRLAAAGDQAPGHAVDHPRVQVVVAHELLHRQRQLVAGVAEVLRDLRLDVARQHVVLVAGQEVQLVPHPPQEGERLVGRLLLPLGDEPLVRQLAERPGAELGGGQPHRGVDVAQPSRRLLHVGLAHVGRPAELPVALVPLGERGFQELVEVLLVDVLGQHFPEAVEEPAVAHQEARLLHRGAARKIGARHGQAVRQAAHRVADLQSEVPQGVEDALGHPLDVGAHLAVVDEQQVQVRERMQLAAAIAAERHQDHRARGEALAARVLHRQPVEGGQEAIHERGVGLHRLLAGGAAQVGRAQEVDVGGQVLAQHLESEPAPPLRDLGRAAFETLVGLRLDPANLSKQFRRHGETVAWTDKKVKPGANLYRSNCRG